VLVTLGFGWLVELSSIKRQPFFYLTAYIRRQLNVNLRVQKVALINPLMPTLKLHSNVLLYSNTANGTLAVDDWAVTFGTARLGLGGMGPRPVPSSL